jgi:RND superfamily putative drug exporter
VTQWPPHDPTRPAVEGSARPEAAARPASTPSAATTTPMPNTRTARADEPTVTQISMANDPSPNGDGEVTAARQPTDGTASPSAQGEDRGIESWLGELRPPSTSDTSPARSTDGDDPAAPRAIPTRLQQDPDAT